MAILYFLGEEPVQNDQQQDCCLIVEVTAPDGIDSRWVHQAVENEIEEQFGKRLTLWSINEDEALHYLEAMPVSDWCRAVLSFSADSMIWRAD